MVYKYSSSDTLYLNDIDNFINNNLTIKKIVNKNRINFICYLFILLVVCYLLLLLSTKMLWKDSYIKPFLTWAILAIISFFLFPKLSLHGLKKSIISNSEQMIEEIDTSYYYSNNGKSIKLTKNPDITILEIIKLNKITFILISPKKSRKFVKNLFPILVPNSLFNSEEQYKNFIESITD
ncbi:MAG: hypothetical protein E6X34_11885 [Clostridium sp.]|uniref:hypothetical protein n=1 Tax=Clostridium sp. TaxID=1506 RepID=UPI00290B9CFE|nr:hypothetical protein [Clostridium sp.]MDU4939147.1 hypothetical protein [Clostridium sp.]